MEGQLPAYVRNAQSGKVVSLAVLGATHPLSRATTSATQSRRHVRALLGSDASGSGLVAHASGVVGDRLANRGHGVLVRTPRGEMLAVADTALDLLVLELVLHRLGVGVVALVLGVLAPVDAGAEDDVLTDRGGVVGRARAVLRALAELAPCFPIRDARVHRLLMGDVAHTAGRLDFVALVVVAECDDGLRAVLVGDGLGGWEVGGRLLGIVVVGPVVP